jgi:hypothetical protein
MAALKHNDFVCAITYDALYNLVVLDAILTNALRNQRTANEQKQSNFKTSDGAYSKRH